MKALLRGGMAGFALIGGVLGLLAGVAHAKGRCDERIRVLLMRDVDELVVEVGGRRQHLYRTRGGEVRVPGGGSRASWHPSDAGPIRVAGEAVRGTIEVHGSEQGLWVVNSVPLEEYVAGALSGEIPASWHEEALRAQAVVSRTYALHQRRANGPERAYDVTATTRSQVYSSASAVPDSLREAVEATRCEVLTDRGGPILAAFHSASGGRTEAADEVWGRALPYLVSREVADEDDSPDTYWRAALSRTTLGQAFSAAGFGLGSIRDVHVVERSPSGRARRVRVRGKRAEVEITGAELRDLLGESTLRSTLFEVRVTEDAGGEAGERDFLFVGSGSGHGVGMSQWGARAMARKGAGYREILSAFYPGVRLVRWDGERVAEREGQEQRVAKRVSEAGEPGSDR